MKCKLCGKKLKLMPAIFEEIMNYDLICPDSTDQDPHPGYLIDKHISGHTVKRDQLLVL